MRLGLLLLLWPTLAHSRPADVAAVQEDFALIAAAAKLKPGSLTVVRLKASKQDRAEVICGERAVKVAVYASDDEWGPTAYRALETLGFLFPHPRRQVSPTMEKIRVHCGETVEWRPRFKKRGFHLHTQHPTEYMWGFLDGRETLAEDVVRWHARNRQNLLQVVALKTVKDLPGAVGPSFALARRLGIETGLSVSFSSLQQKSLRLLDWPLPLLPAARWLPGLAAKREGRRAGELADAIDFDFMSAELGTSEFTAQDPRAALDGLEAVRAALESRGRRLFVKVHVSSNQTLAGENFNFLPAAADPRVGVLVHTVMPFALTEPAPVYGRKDFADILAFLRAQKAKRPTWYFPETSYFISVDIDVPLFLTGYLDSRAADLDLLAREKAEGVLDFSTGQELGYWLMDWTHALGTGDAPGPYAGLERLGENKVVWKRILDWQDLQLKKRGLISVLSFPNLMDELPGVARRHRVLDRDLLDELEKDPAALKRQLDALEDAVATIPPTKGVKDEELRLALDVTFARARHALSVRRAIADRTPEGRAARLDDAAAVRRETLPKAEALATRFSRYPEAGVFARGPNLTSYAFGYGWPARTLWWWEREEEQVRGRRRSPFFRQLYELRRILL